MSEYHEQLSLLTETTPIFSHYEPGAYRHDDPDTSVAAAMSLDAARMEAIVLEALRKCDNGGTSRELAEIMGLPGDSVSPRLRPLARKGLIYATSERRVGKSGRSGIVWKAR